MMIDDDDDDESLMMIQQRQRGVDLMGVDLFHFDTAGFRACYSTVPLHDFLLFAFIRHLGPKLTPDDFFLSEIILSNTPQLEITSWGSPFGDLQLGNPSWGFLIGDPQLGNPQLIPNLGSPIGAHFPTLIPHHPTIVGSNPGKLTLLPKEQSI